MNIKKLLNFRTETARELLLRYVRIRFQHIEVWPGACRYNFRCHNNAIHEAKENGWGRIAMVVYVEGGDVIPHFINVDDEEMFIENTFGHNIEDKEYYLIRYITEPEFEHIYYLHYSLHDELKAQLGWFTRVFSDIL